MNIGNRITDLRNQLGYTTNKLAKLAGVSQSYLRDIELGNKKPGIDILDKLCNALNVTLAEFFSTHMKRSALLDRLVETADKLDENQLHILIAFLDSLDTHADNENE